MSELQKEHDRADRLREYVLKNAHRMSAQAIATELNVSVFAVNLFYPNPSR